MMTPLVHAMTWLLGSVAVLLALTRLPRASALSPSEKAELAAEVKDMFQHTYQAYMQHAYPADELMPLSCKGRVRGIDKSRGDTDHAMGGFSLTLIDTLDTLAVMGNFDEFMRAVHLVSTETRFDSDLVVSVFEVTIRALGGLLSAHVLAEEVQKKGLAKGQPPYTGALLEKALDLGERLLVAFDTPTGVPYLRVNLATGNVAGEDQSTCVACAGSLILEFATLARLTGRPEFEIKARNAVQFLFSGRSRSSHLVGRLVNTQTGHTSTDGGIGAGIDSYYEYLLKAYVLLNDPFYLHMFDVHYRAISKHIKKGSFYMDVDVTDTRLLTRPQQDSLTAFWPAVQVLVGDLPDAMEMHRTLFEMSMLHGGLLPEAYGKDFTIRDHRNYLRPELIESTFFLYEATGSRELLQVGKQAVRALQDKAKVECGYAALTNVTAGTKEDRLDSFFLAETLKYLYLLFEDPSNITLDLSKYVFSTEAHLLPTSVSLLPAPVPRTKLRPAAMYQKNGGWQAHTCLSHPPFNAYGVPSHHDMDRAMCLSDVQLEGQWAAEVVKELDWKGRAKVVVLERLKLVTVTLVQHKGQSTMELRLAGKRDSRPMTWHEVETLWNSVTLARPELIGATIDTKLCQIVARTADNKPISLEAYAADFGKTSQSVTGLLTYAKPLDSCHALHGDLTGHIAMISRGNCSFVSKVRQAQQANATAAIIYDADSDGPVTMIADGEDIANVTLFSVFVAGNAARTLRGMAELSVSAPVRVSIVANQAQRT